MAASIESRVPFLDHALVEFAARIPDRLKIRGRDTKVHSQSRGERFAPARDRPSQKDGVSHASGAMAARSPGRTALRPLAFTGRAAGGTPGSAPDGRAHRAASLGARGCYRSHLAASQSSALGRSFSDGPARPGVDMGRPHWHEDPVGEIGFSASHQRRRADPNARNTEAAAPAGTRFILPRSICRSRVRDSAAAPNTARRRTRYRTRFRARADRITGWSWPPAPGPICLFPCAATGRAPCCVWWRPSRAWRNSTPSCAIFWHRRPMFPSLDNAVLFQHNVESMIWQRHIEHAPSPWHRAYYRGQYERMLRYEAEVCRAAKKIIAVSGADARAIHSLYGATRVYSVPTGVDIGIFRSALRADCAQAGPGVCWRHGLAAEHRRSEMVCRRSASAHPRAPAGLFAGRGGPASRRGSPQTRQDATRTFMSLAPWTTCARICGNRRCPSFRLRVGGGTRLKIYEAMAAKIPVVSTSVGAEGLDIRDGENIAIADSPQEFAERCLALLGDAGARRRMAATAWEMVAACYSWEVVSRKFEQLLLHDPLP